MSTVGAMFLRNPSLLNKKPSTLAAKAAALRALPGLQPEQAAAAMAAMPSLLNLDPARLQDRWQRLQQVRQRQRQQAGRCGGPRARQSWGRGLATRLVCSLTVCHCAVSAGSRSP